MYTKFGPEEEVPFIGFDVFSKLGKNSVGGNRQGHMHLIILTRGSLVTLCRHLWGKATWESGSSALPISGPPLNRCSWTHPSWWWKNTSGISSTNSTSTVLLLDHCLRDCPNITARAMSVKLIPSLLIYYLYPSLLTYLFMLHCLCQILLMFSLPIWFWAGWKLYLAVTGVYSLHPSG